MKIALISYEYPPETAVGGIATYVHQAARMLKQRGHHVEVFSGSAAVRDIKENHLCSTEIQEDIIVHRIPVHDRCSDFPTAAGLLFAKRHEAIKFDVLEGPEFQADAAYAVRLVPDIPLVVKLHTPKYMLDILGNPIQTWQAKTRLILGTLRQGKLPLPPKAYNRYTDPEYLHILDADEIVAPSQAIGEKLIADWHLDKQKVVNVPYPYIPSPDLLTIPAQTQTNVVSFLGRLEIRKGILDLAQAIPQILQKHPNVKFRFIGPAWPSPKRGLDMQQYLETKLRKYASSMEFTGSVALDNIPFMLAATDICIFPSRWENFPNVCLEAMAAARGVVGSSAGGMAEMLDSNNFGRIVPPRSPQKIASAVIELLDNPELRIQLGQAARNRILTEYNTQRIGALQEASYQRAIERRHILGKRIINNISR